MKGMPMNAWVLGGSSGLGRELAEEAKRRGITPSVLGRNADYHVDLSDRSSVDALCKKIITIDADVLRSVSFFVWNAGELEYRSADEMESLDRMFAVNMHGPTQILQSFIKRKKALCSPFHLIAISSVASWKARAKLAVYAGTKAYQAQFLRCLAIELARDIPVSKVTIALPAGMKSRLFPADIDTSGFMETADVAEIVWREAETQERSCDWFNVLRVDGKPVVSREHFAPELAYDELPMYNRGSSPQGEK